MKNKKIFNKSEDHQHFGLRKLSVGVASVLLGTTFMIYGGRTVQADNTSQVITSQVANNDNSSSVKNVNDIDSKAKNTQVDALQIEEHQHQAVIDTRNNETAKVNNDEEKKDTGSSALENEDAKKVEEKSDSTVANVTKSDANNASSVNNVKSNEASNNSVVEHQQNVTDEKKNDSPISNEELEKIFKLNKPDLSNDQLAALGLKPGEYKLGDIIYNAKGTAVITDRSGKEYNIDNLKVLHNADGSAHNADKDLDFIRAMVVDRLAKAHFTIKYIPAIDGSTIYVNKDAVLSSEDAKRGVINSSSTDLKNAVSYNWDNSNKDYAVSTKDVGTYNGMIDVAYQIGKDKPLTKVAVGVKVVVVDLNGKDQYTHIGADIPTAETSINGAPAGSKATWTEKPSTDKAGKSEGVVEVTYPDGNKGTTTSTLNVIAPDVKDPIHVWEGDPVPKAPTVVNNTGDIANKIPGTTTYTWDKTPDTSVPGTVEGTIVTHWPDGKTTNTSTTIVVDKRYVDVTEGKGTTENITRTIYTQLEGHDPEYKDTQTVTLNRTGTKDLKESEKQHKDVIKWNPWQPQTMNAYQAPEIKNYHVLNPNDAPEIQVNGTTKDMTVTFQYAANHQQITDGDGTHMEVKRDVYTQIDNEKPELLKHQVVILHRTGDKNMVTGEIVWNAWQPGKIDAIDAPAKDGYTLVNPGAATAVTVDGSKKTIDSITYHYTANEQSVNVNYVDEESHKVVTSISVAGKTGETVSFDAQSHVPTGWVIVAGQTVPDHFTFIGTPLKDQTILIHHNENDRYKVVADGDVTTHVGANENVPSLTASGVKLSWSEDGKTVSAPDGVNVAWENVPATNKIANEQGTLKVTFKDGTTTTVNVSVTVQGATAGDLQTVDQNADVPEAKTTVNTSTVDHFGITNVEWSKEPSTKTPGADIPGVARVNYSDGTYQDVDVALDVRGVEHGQDHQDDEDLFLSFEQTDTVELPGGITKNEIITTNLIRDRITDYKYPVGDSRRVTYTDWVTQTVVKYA